MATFEKPTQELNISKTMESNIKTLKNQNKPKQLGVYNQAILTKKVIIPIISVGKNIRNILEKVITSKYEGRCDVDGYIKTNSSRIITYSSGILKGSDIIFEVVFECLVCYPVEGMLVQCLVKNVTKAGIRAEIPEGPDEISPVVIFIARDHHLTSTYFGSVQPGQNIQVRVIGSRFELNDKYVSVIAELIEPKPLFTKKSVIGSELSGKSIVAAKTLKATSRGRQLVKPLSTIVSEEEAEPLNVQELTIAAPGQEEDIEKEEEVLTAKVQESEPSFKPTQLQDVENPITNLVEDTKPVKSQQIEQIVEELPKQQIEQVTTKKPITIKKKLIIKSKIEK